MSDGDVSCSIKYFTTTNEATARKDPSVFWKSLPVDYFQKHPKESCEKTLV